MANFNYYLNRQGSSGRQGVKGDKGEAGYSPYIDIKSNTPTEFIMTIHNETESFDTPNLIPTAIGEKVTEMDAVLTTHTEDIANLKLDITAIKNKDTAQDSDIAALKTRVGGTEESIEDLNHKYTVLGSEVSDLTLTKQNKLVEGANITLTDNADGTTTISASGGGGGGGSDVPIATTQVAGKVKPDGETITVTSDGTISSVSKDVTPIATISTVGKVRPDGTTITITDDGTISAVGGGGGTPENMMTIDTNQTVSGVKTFTNGVDIGISGLESRITTTNNSESGQRQDLSIVSSGDLALSTGNVAFTDNDGGIHVRQGKIIDGSGNVVLTQGNVTAGNNITITKTSKGIQIASSGGGGSAPANMVTTDTNQDITGIKTFKGNVNNNDPSIIFGGKRYGLDDSIGGKIKVNGNNSFEISTGAKGDSGLVLRMDRSANNSPSYFEFTSNSSVIPPAIKLGKTNYQGTIEYDTSTYPNGFLFKTQNALSGYAYSSFKIGDDTLTFKKTDGTVVDLLNNSSKEQYGIRADYALTHGIVDNPNGIISYNTTDKVITVHQGLVLSCAGSNTAKTIISGDMQHTVTSTENFTLFYANGELLECGKVDYSTEEPTNNGVTNYQAWFNPDKTVNTNQQWQFKSNDTGNAWRYVDNSTPLADIVADSTTITSVSYLGYRIFDDDVFAHKSEWVYVNKQLLSNVNRTTENIIVDLSNSLPDDGATYDVLFSSTVQPTVVKNKFCAVLSSNGEISPSMRVSQSRVAVADVDASANGAFLLPITPSRSITLGGSSSGNNSGTITLWMHAYKKIG